jgi:hypothetical protein
MSGMHIVVCVHVPGPFVSVDFSHHTLGLSLEISTQLWNSSEAVAVFMNAHSQRAAVSALEGLLQS